MSREREILAEGILYRDETVLLVQETYPPRWWNLPGGQVESGETAAEALSRELREELGIEKSAESLSFVRDRGDQLVFVFSIEIASTDSFQPDAKEIAAIHWVDRSVLDSGLNLSDLTRQILTACFQNDGGIGTVYDRRGTSASLYRGISLGPRAFPGQIGGINHITLSVRNAAESLRFYQDVLGLKPVATWPTGAYVVAGDTWIALHQDEATRSAELPEYTHIAFSVPRSAFAAISDKLRKSGAKIWQENATEGESIYFVDPNGHKLELHASDLKRRLESARQNPWPGLRIHE